jgi:adenylyltransferase/sulfurtransferase
MTPEITPRELAEAMKGDQRPVLIDVREASEFAFCRLEGAQLRPLGQIRAWAGELDKEANLVVYCHTGFRSGQAVMYLRSLGFERVWNLRGGIDAWAAQVDPTVPRY